LYIVKIIYVLWSTAAFFVVGVNVSGNGKCYFVKKNKKKTKKTLQFYQKVFWTSYHQHAGGRRGRDRMVVGLYTTYAISAYHHWCCELESRSVRGVQHYVKEFVSDLRQVGCFLRVLRFPQPIKRTATM
jgi:hypothetical protein